MIKFLDTIGGFIDLAVSIIISPLILLVHIFIGTLISIRYIKLYSHRISNYLMLKKWPSFQISWRLPSKFSIRLMPLRKLIR
ncbi:MAG: hypothetical protein ACJ748_14305 [Flavisolibacter sp.]